MGGSEPPDYILIIQLIEILSVRTRFFMTIPPVSTFPQSGCGEQLADSSEYRAFMSCQGLHVISEQDSCEQQMKLPL